MNTDAAERAQATTLRSITALVFIGPGLRLRRNRDDSSARDAWASSAPLVPAVGHPVVAAQVAGFDDAVGAGGGGAPGAKRQPRKAQQRRGHDGDDGDGQRED